MPNTNNAGVLESNDRGSTDNGASWQQITNATNHIMYSASWGAGLLALNVGAPVPEPSSLALSGAAALAALTLLTRGRRWRFK